MRHRLGWTFNPTVLSQNWVLNLVEVVWETGLQQTVDRASDPPALFGTALLLLPHQITATSVLSCGRQLWPAHVWSGLEAFTVKELLLGPQDWLPAS